MFLVDTNVISETRKGTRADPEVLDFFLGTEEALFLPVQVIGEIRSGIEALQRRPAASADDRKLVPIHSR